MRNKIFITGIGTLSALGFDQAEIAQNFEQGVSKLTIKSDWKNEKIRPKLYGRPTELDFEKEVNWEERILPNTYSKLGILACHKAIRDAGLVLEKEDNEIGLVIETCLAATESVEDYLTDLYTKGVTRVSPLKFTRTVANSVLGDVSRYFKLNGPSSLLYNENSLSYGFDLIQKGVVDIVICGGVDHFAEFRILSEQENDLLIEETGDILEYLKHQKDLEKSILGDGSAFVVLESEKSFKQRKVRAYAELLDYHSNFDYENVNCTYKRHPHILNQALLRFQKYFKNNEPIIFTSAYLSRIQYKENEEFIVEQLMEQHPVRLVYHKPYTGDMKAASNVMSICLTSHLLKIQNQNEPQGILTYAIVNNTHEGGSNSQFILKQCN